MGTPHVIAYDLKSINYGQSSTAIFVALTTPSFIKLSLFAALLIPCTYTYVIYDGTFPLCTANGPTYMISKYPKCIDKCKTSSHRTFHVLACHLHKTSFWKSQAEPPRKYITWLCWYKGHIDYIIFSYNIVVVPRLAYPKLAWENPYRDTKSATMLRLKRSRDMYPYSSLPFSVWVSWSTSPGSYSLIILGR